jgi:hypothetical protein
MNGSGTDRDRDHESESESPDDSADGSEYEYDTCPRCGRTIHSIVVRGPSPAARYAQPCGHRLPAGFDLVGDDHAVTSDTNTTANDDQAHDTTHNPEQEQEQVDETETEPESIEIVCYRRSIDRETEAKTGDETEVETDGWMFRGEAVHQWLFAPAHACIELPEER